MAKTIDVRIAETKEKLTQTENQYKKLLQQQKEQERKARTRRLIERGAIVESLIEGAETMSNEDIRERLWSMLHVQGGSHDAPPATEAFPDGHSLA